MRKVGRQAAFQNGLRKAQLCLRHCCSYKWFFKPCSWGQSCCEIFFTEKLLQEAWISHEIRKSREAFFRTQLLCWVGKVYSQNDSLKTLVEIKALLLLMKYLKAICMMSSEHSLRYSRPPVVPTTTSPLHLKESSVSGTSSYSSSLLGSTLWRLGVTCCPCLEGSAFPQGESAGVCHVFIREFLKKISPGNREEACQPFKRTQSEEELFKKKPQRGIISSNKSSEALSSRLNVDATSAFENPCSTLSVINKRDSDLLSTQVAKVRFKSNRCNRKSSKLWFGFLLAWRNFFE